ncbi:CYCLOPS [Zea mays]|uniref:CYCLOPS n=1 Tax=Zea mays TaxID=4577 RepID=A0A1D6NWL9_MAIZE|nr:CYCLOPS [Zea mays]
MQASDLLLAKAWFHSTQPMTRSRSSELRQDLLIPCALLPSRMKYMVLASVFLVIFAGGGMLRCKLIWHQ